MIEISTNTILFNGGIYQIHYWNVWYMTPMGLFQDREWAIREVTKNDMDPNFTVVPVPVAIGPNDIYEVYTRM